MQTPKNTPRYILRHPTKQSDTKRHTHRDIQTLMKAAKQIFIQQKRQQDRHPNTKEHSQIVIQTPKNTEIYSYPDIQHESQIQLQTLNKTARQKSRHQRTKADINLHIKKHSKIDIQTPNKTARQISRHQRQQPIIRY